MNKLMFALALYLLLAGVVFAQRGFRGGYGRGAWGEGGWIGDDVRTVHEVPSHTLSTTS